MRPNTVTPPSYHAFHRLWTWAVGKDGYDKKAWQDTEKLLFAETRYASEYANLDVCDPCGNGEHAACAGCSCSDHKREYHATPIERAELQTQDEVADALLAQVRSHTAVFSTAGENEPPQDFSHLRPEAMPSIGRSVREGMGGSLIPTSALRGTAPAPGKSTYQVISEAIKSWGTTGVRPQFNVSGLNPDEAIQWLNYALDEAFAQQLDLRKSKDEIAQRMEPQLQLFASIAEALGLDPNTATGQEVIDEAGVLSKYAKKTRQRLRDLVAQADERQTKVAEALGLADPESQGWDPIMAAIHSRMNEAFKADSAKRDFNTCKRDLKVALGVTQEPHTWDDLIAKVHELRKPDTVRSQYIELIGRVSVALGYEEPEPVPTDYAPDDELVKLAECTRERANARGGYFTLIEDVAVALGYDKTQGTITRDELVDLAKLRRSQADANTEAIFGPRAPVQVNAEAAQICLDADLWACVAGWNEAACLARTDRRAPHHTEFEARAIGYDLCADRLRGVLVKWGVPQGATEAAPVAELPPIDQSKGMPGLPELSPAAKRFRDQVGFCDRSTNLLRRHGSYGEVLRAFERREYGDTVVVDSLRRFWAAIVRAMVARQHGYTPGHINAPILNDKQLELLVSIDHSALAGAHSIAHKLHELHVEERYSEVYEYVLPTSIELVALGEDAC